MIGLLGESRVARRMGEKGKMSPHGNLIPLEDYERLCQITAIKQKSSRSIDTKQRKKLSLYIPRDDYSHRCESYQLLCRDICIYRFFAFSRQCYEQEPKTRTKMDEKKKRTNGVQKKKKYIYRESENRSCSGMILHRFVVSFNVSCFEPIIDFDSEVDLSSHNVNILYIYIYIYTYTYTSKL